MEGGLGLLLTLLFVFGGGLPWLDGLIRSPGFSEVLTGVLFIGALALAGDLLATPFDIYSTFVLEERYGFNRTTLREFVKDKIKGWALGIVIAGPILAAVLWFFQNWEGVAWLFAWGVVTLFMLLLHYLAPSVLLPLFNKFTPLEDGELRQRIVEYARGAGFALTGIYVMDGSRRSTKANAFFTGFGKRKRIALFDTLIQRHTPDEIVAVLAHEVGHFKKKHVLLLMALTIVKVGVLLYLVGLLLEAESLFAAFHVRPSTYIGLLLFGLLFTPLSVLLSLPMNWLSRTFEFQADTFAVRTTSKGEDLITALKRLVTHSLGNVTPHPLDVALRYSHPPILERIRNIRRKENNKI